MKRKLPSLVALQCFEASARHSSLTKAADELCLTQGAVSRNIKNLEELLGQLLFNRIKHKIVLTEAGESFLVDTRHILEALTSTMDKHQVAERNAVKLSLISEPTLTAELLLSHYLAFSQSHPDIEIDLNTDVIKLYNDTRDFDISILWGDGNWPDCKTMFFLDVDYVLVARPDIVTAKYPLENDREVLDILDISMVHQTSILSLTEMWLKKLGFTEQEVKAMPGQRFEHMSLLKEAALQGLGATVLPDYLAEDKLQSGELVSLLKEPIKLDGEYYIAIPNCRPHQHESEIFAKWLLERMQK